MHWPVAEYSHSSFCFFMFVIWHVVCWIGFIRNPMNVFAGIPKSTSSVCVVCACYFLRFGFVLGVHEFIEIPIWLVPTWDGFVFNLLLFFTRVW